MTLPSDAPNSYWPSILFGGIAVLLLLIASILFFGREETEQIATPAVMAEPPDGNHERPLDLSDSELEAIHSDWLPEWALSRVGQIHGEPTRTRDQLLESLQNAPVLHDIVRSLETSSDDPKTTSSDEILPLCWTWNQYLDEHDRPWRIRCNMVVREDERWFYITGYQVLADVQVDVEDTPQRVRLLRRMDRTGAREPYLGHAGTQSEGALLVLDRIRDFAMNSVWPLMDPEFDDLQNEFTRALAPEIRLELTRSLSVEHLTNLRRTAGIRLEMVEIWNEMEPIRRCRGLEQLRLSWWGVSPESLMPLVNESEEEHQNCPNASPDDLGRLLQLTEDLAMEAELLPALDHILAWTAHPIIVHEARHLADRTTDGSDGPPCPGCSRPLSAAERSELSAYLSTLTHPSLSNLSRLQACEALSSLPTESIHAQALQELQRQGLENMCSEAIPDFINRSQAAMARLLGRSPFTTMSIDFPRRLPVTLGPPPAQNPTP